MTYFHKYIEQYIEIVKRTKNIDNFYNKIKKFKKKNKGKIILLGNGGSSAISSHIATDFTKASGIRAITFSDPDMLTCYSNDYGYEKWMEVALKNYSSKNDLVILVSSSGNSPNIINAAKFCKNHKIDLITFSGFSKKNKLQKYGSVNIWIDSKSYNFIEVAHLQILASAVDKFLI
tara:strand:- start:824 stop:1351 length:528 start_codon:yes stop_codon:yes gene_type:complete